MWEFMPYLILGVFFCLAADSFRMEGNKNKSALDIIWGIVVVILSVFLSYMAYNGYSKPVQGFTLLQTYAWFFFTFIMGSVSLINGIWKMRLKKISLNRLENFQKYGTF